MNHFRLKDVKEVIDRFPYSQKVKDNAYEVYKLIAEAESVAHNEPVEEVHFHEVGTIDAIVDITTVCFLIDKLGVDEIYSTPIKTGFGTVECAHGTLPVPAPATAYLLEGMPHYKGDVKSELCTPTGAALLKFFVTDFVDNFPENGKVGVGFGKRKFKQPNVFKACIPEHKECDDALILECNIDDMTGEELGFAADRLRAMGAKDVTIIPAYMKKNRPGFILTVMINPDEKDIFAGEIFKITSTLGIREIPVKREILEREIIEHQTNLGKVRHKHSEGYGVRRNKLEYEDLARIASDMGLSIMDVREILIKGLNL